MDKSNSKIKNIPNILTISRIVLVPIIICFMLVEFGDSIYTIKFSNVEIKLGLNLFLAALLFLISSFTDFLDGYIARKYKCVSDFGKFWDPIADKILVNSTLFCLAFKEYIPFWIPIIILIRDIIIDGIRINAIKKQIVIPANIWGKLKTIFQMIAIIIVFFFGVQFNSSLNNWWYWFVQNVLNYIAMILSIASLIIYWLQYSKKVKDKENEQELHS
ncbi:MAG: CDP-diacylglycerol--glycerol-3-phosphate 3-phosphatidyltransferase [Ureaplasma sp.]|nr:CDP-diacylglycerol--glycerol-3-phosphate 3-phosphatidyltransferase [Ureaplasma sp.]